MPPLRVDRRHNEYEEWREACEFLWTSYLGGRAYLESAALDQYPRELSDVYEARRERSYLLNYLAGVVDTYISSVYRRDPVREPETNEAQQQPQPIQRDLEQEQPAAEQQTTEAKLSGALGEFEQDATGDGTNLTDFMREVATWALATERAFVVVDVDGGGRPYMHQLHPSNLLDFSVSGSGFEWALTAESHVEDSDPFVERVEETRYRLWTASEWMLFDHQAQQIDSGANRAGRVPIVHVPGERANLPIYDIATINKRIYNLCSQLDEILINNTFPQRYMQGEGVEDEQGEAISGDTSPIAVGTARILELPLESKIAPGYLAPPDGPARLHIDERERLIESIYSLAGLERRDPDSQRAQSGVAKAYDFRETNERLVSLAQTMEAAEEEIFSLVAAYGVPADVNVTYQKDFNVEDFTVQLDNYIKLSGAQLPAEVKKRAAMEVAMSVAEEATEEERREIRRSVENMPANDLSGGRRRSILDELNAPESEGFEE